jgi:hypothetical protein
LCRFLKQRVKLFFRQRKKRLRGFLESSGFVRLDVVSVTFRKTVDEKSPLAFPKYDDAAIPA